MILKKGQLPILIVNLIYLVIATIFYLGKENYEFILYVGVIILFFVLILATNKKVDYPNVVLWGLTVWGILHMLGGGLIVNGAVLYKFMIFNITDNIFRFDQFVHIFGFMIATLLIWVLLKPKLKKNCGWAAVSVVVVMAGFGIGALNEVVEFLATVLVPETGVGGYVNTSLDLVADLIGAILAMVWIRIRKGDI
jgi:uncharacterized membrane protein YjdF